MKNLVKIKEKLLISLKEHNCMPVASEEITDTKITLTMASSPLLSIIIDGSEMVVIYNNEHDNFFRNTYDSDDEWIASFSDFVSKISNNTVIFSYVYVKSTLIRYKVVIKYNDGTFETLKRVAVSSNIFLKLFHKEETIQEILFCPKKEE